MRTFTSNLIVLTAVVDTNSETITGSAIDRDISIRYSVKLSDTNQAIVIPEANLVVTGSLRIAKEIASVNVWINSIIAVVSLPEPEAIATDDGFVALIPDNEAPAELVEAMAETMDAPLEAVAEIVEAPTEAVAEILEAPTEVVVSKTRKSSKRKVLAEVEADLVAF